MSQFIVRVDGADKTNAKLAAITEAQLARTAVAAAMKVLRSAGVKASPGRVKLEWGSQRNSGGMTASGTIGLGVGGYRSKVKRPHGKYLEFGTKYIAARHFAEQAIINATEKAIGAMKRAVKNRLETLTK